MINTYDRSGTIISGGTPQELVPKNDTRRRLLFQNLSSTAMYLNPNGVATPGAGSIKIQRDGLEGSIVDWADHPAQEAISLYCATTDAQYTCKEV